MEKVPDLYEIFEGEVATVTDYGAFIKIPGCRKQGLVHKTQMSSSRVELPSEIMDVGDKVWVKVIGCETKDGKEKISLSMKVVNQGTGKDLDTNNVILEQDEKKKREFKDYSKQKIVLEAVLNTVCKKCGCKGHFANDCFVQPGGTKYGLLPDEEEDEDAAKESRQPVDKQAKKKNKEKKRKKHHRSKPDAEDRSDSSDSESSDSGPSKKKSRHDEKSKKTSKKKKRKHKKHKHKDHKKDE